MLLAEALSARLEAASAVTNIAGQRIYWTQRPQGDPVPAVVMRGSGGVDLDDLNDDAAYAETRITASCFGRNSLEAKQLARAVKATLKPAAVQGGFSFDASDIGEPIDLGELGVAGWEHRADLDCVIRHGAET
jgi:hypothetical protein